VEEGFTAIPEEALSLSATLNTTSDWVYKYGNKLTSRLGVSSSVPRRRPPPLIFIDGATSYSPNTITSQLIALEIEANQSPIKI
jgi:hypothetical protein